MSVFVSRRPDGSIYGRFTTPQYDKQEELPDDHPDLLAADFAMAKAKLIRDVSSQLRSVLAAGLSWHGVVYQIDDASQNVIAMLAAKAARANGKSGTTWDKDFCFVAADNNEHPFTAAEFGLFADAVTDAVIAFRLNARKLKNAILASTPKTFATIDITAGWNLEPTPSKPVAPASAKG